MANSLFPGFFRFFYKNGGQEHRHEVPIVPSVDGASITAISLLRQANGDGVAVTAAAEAYATAFRKLHPTTTTVERWELYSVASPGAIPVLQALGSINLPGTGVGAKVEDSQATITFKTKAGGLIKVVVLDTYFQYDQIVSTYTVGGTVNESAYIEYMLGPTNIRVGRDNAFPLTFKRIVTKQNDALRKARLNL